MSSTPLSPECRMDHVIEVDHLRHQYAKRVIYQDLNFKVPRGKVFGLLGKNGVGKTTLIKILMGFLRPTGGTCRVFGDDSHQIAAATRRRIGLLFEGHLAYEFMSIAGAERFFAPFYPHWRRELYYDLTDRLGLPKSHKIGNMSEGQRSQVVLGLLMAQQPEMLILDDYTMGLDAGYRRLFLDYLVDYLRQGQRTVLLTTHIVQDLEKVVDEVLFLERGGHTTQMPLPDFLGGFKQYRLAKGQCASAPAKDEMIKNVEESGQDYLLYSFAERQSLRGHLESRGVSPDGLEQVPMSFEDAFIGFTGRY